MADEKVQVLSSGSVISAADTMSSVTLVKGVAEQGDKMNVLSGGFASDTTVNSGAVVNVNAGGSAYGVTVNDFGSADVRGVASGVTVSGTSDKTTVKISAGAVVDDLTVSGKAKLIMTGGTLNNWHHSAYTAQIYGGTVNGLYQSANWNDIVGASVVVNGGKKTGGQITFNAGTLNDFENAGGTLLVGNDPKSTPVANNLLVTGGTARVYNQGRVNDVTVNGGTLLLGNSPNAGESGGVASNVTLSAGTVNVSYDGQILGDFKVLGGTVELYNGATLGDLTMDGGVIRVNDTTSVGALTLNGGTATVSSGGTVNGDVTVGAGGNVEVRSGGIVSGTITVQSGGILNNGSGKYYDCDVVLENGAIANANGATFNGTITIKDNCQLETAKTVFNSLNYLTADSVIEYDLRSATHNKNSGMFIWEASYMRLDTAKDTAGSFTNYDVLVGSGTTYGSFALHNNGALTGGIDIIAVDGDERVLVGTQQVAAGKSVTGTVFEYQGYTYQIMKPNGYYTRIDVQTPWQLWKGATQVGGGAGTVSGLVLGTSEESGTTLRLTSAGADATTLTSGGAIVISKGGFATNTVISSGANLTVSSAGSVSGTVISNGGCIWASSGSLVNDLTMSAGANARFYNAHASGVTMNGNEIQISGKDAVMEDATIATGWTHVQSGATVNNATMTGGQLSTYAGNLVSAFTQNGGTVRLLNTTAKDYTVNGGTLNASATTFDDFTVNSRAVYVSAESVLNNTTITSNGTVNLYNSIVGADGEVSILEQGGVLAMTNGTINGLITVGAGQFQTGGAITVGETGRINIELDKRGDLTGTVAVTEGAYLKREGGDAFTDYELTVGKSVEEGGTQQRGTYYIFNKGGFPDAQLTINNYDDNGNVTYLGKVSSNTWFDTGDMVISWTRDGSYKISATVLYAAELLNAGSAFQSGARVLTGVTLADESTRLGRVYTGGTIADAVINYSAAEIQGYSGGTIRDLTMNTGYVHAYAGTYVSGGNYNGGQLNIFGTLSGGTMNDGMVNAGIKDGGKAYDVTLSGGYLQVSSGGYVSGVTMYKNAGNGNELNVRAGGKVEGLTQSGAWVNVWGELDGATTKKGKISVCDSGAKVKNVTVDGGELGFSSSGKDGVAEDVTITANGGYLGAVTSGTIKNLTVYNNKAMGNAALSLVYDGLVDLRGGDQWDPSGAVKFADTATLNFTLSADNKATPVTFNFLIGEASNLKKASDTTQLFTNYQLSTDSGDWAGSWALFNNGSLTTTIDLYVDGEVKASFAVTAKGSESYETSGYYEDANGYRYYLKKSSYYQTEFYKVAPVTVWQGAWYNNQQYMSSVIGGAKTYTDDVTLQGSTVSGSKNVENFMTIRDGGRATGTVTAADKGSVQVSSGGIADKVVVTSGGNVIVSSGATVSDLNLSEAGANAALYTGAVLGDVYVAAGQGFAHQANVTVTGTLTIGGVSAVTTQNVLLMGADAKVSFDVASLDSLTKDTTMFFEASAMRQEADPSAQFTNYEIVVDPDKEIAGTQFLFNNGSLVGTITIVDTDGNILGTQDVVKASMDLADTPVTAANGKRYWIMKNSYYATYLMVGAPVELYNGKFMTSGAATLSDATVGYDQTNNSVKVYEGATVSNLTVAGGTAYVKGGVVDGLTLERVASGSGFVSATAYVSSGATVTGAVVNSGTSIQLEGGTVTDLTLAGGRISLLSDDEFTISNVTFGGNTATNGGAIYNGADSVLTIGNVVFNGNKATKGGAIYNETASVTVNGKITLGTATDTIVTTGDFLIDASAFGSDDYYTVVEAAASGLYDASKFKLTDASQDSYTVCSAGKNLYIRRNDADFSSAILTEDGTATAVTVNGVEYTGKAYSFANADLAKAFGATTMIYSGYKYSGGNLQLANPNTTGSVTVGLKDSEIKGGHVYGMSSTTNTVAGDFTFQVENTTLEKRLYTAGSGQVSGTITANVVNSTMDIISPTSSSATFTVTAMVTNLTDSTVTTEVRGTGSSENVTVGDVTINLAGTNTLGKITGCYGNTVTGSAALNVNSGATTVSGAISELDTITIASGAELRYQGGTITCYDNGTFTNNGTFTVAGATTLATALTNNGSVVWDLSAANATINDITKVTGTGALVAAVTGDFGSYTLAGNAADFAGSISVKSGDSTLGSVSLSNTLVSGDNFYTLKLDGSSNLVFTTASALVDAVNVTTVEGDTQVSWTAVEGVSYQVSVNGGDWTTEGVSGATYTYTGTSAAKIQVRMTDGTNFGTASETFTIAGTADDTNVTALVTTAGENATIELRDGAYTGTDAITMKNGQTLVGQGTNATSVDKAIYGAGNSVEVKNLQATSNVVGGAANAASEDTDLTVTNALLKDAFGGALVNSTNVTNTTAETTVDGTQFRNLYGAGYVTGNYTLTTENAVLNVTGGSAQKAALAGNVYGAGRAANGGTLNVSNVAVTIDNGIENSLGALYAGGYANSGATLTIGDVATTITTGNFAKFVAGGSQVYGEGTSATATSTTLTIEGGLFGNAVLGASYAAASAEATVTTATTTISGGTFNGYVAGAGYANNGSVTVGSVSLTISGGNFTKYVFGGNVANSEGTTAVTGQVYLTLDASANKISAKQIYAGSFKGGAVGSTVTELKGDGSNLTFARLSGDGSYVEPATTGGVSGTKELKFTGFSGELSGKLFDFDTFTMTNSTVKFAKPQDLSEVSTWNLTLTDSVTATSALIDWSNDGANSFAGDTMNLNFNTAADSDLLVILGDEELDLALSENMTVTFNGNAASYADGAWSLDGWKLSNVQTVVEESTVNNLVLTKIS